MRARGMSIINEMMSRIFMEVKGENFFESGVKRACPPSRVSTGRELKSPRVRCAAVKLIKKGDKVKAGQPIAVIGSTGDADGTHLHFELHKNGSPVDPTPLIGNDP